ncbi:16S rRNA (cytosine(1402)-N(4))-methyltransferase [Candidatus Peregrinibacteria bacterium CG10_big_fil_rev_8_21_14_0_10_36_19]|nr:MAG: 16S rRNA (cytosine(1402)-N(4))-methyltransferase [Candidatus Peregrinibacteria bacterium CG10_big_fil_rev_8_21_14_0_10_36_19]
MEHKSVLKWEVIEFMDLHEGDIVVDGTLGLGGHSIEIVKKIGKSGKLIAFDQDERNLEEAKRRLKGCDQVVYVRDNFRYLKSRLQENGIKEIDAILLDLGLSSPHVDEAERGFSFMKDGPLDMRFNLDNPLTAADVVNDYSESDLTYIFRVYGEEQFAKKIASAMCKRRSDQKFSTTTELAEFIENIVPKKRSGRSSKAHPATKVFQALRIAVNEELDVLKEVLEQTMEVLKVGGRVVVISYHSLEDRIVKHFFKDLIKPEAEGEEAIYSNFSDPIVEAMNKKPVLPTEAELEDNPRSRSARLRAYKKIKPYKS